jgi:hypothetical protein
VDTVAPPAPKPIEIKLSLAIVSVTEGSVTELELIVEVSSMAVSAPAVMLNTHDEWLDVPVAVIETVCGPVGIEEPRK